MAHYSFRDSALKHPFTMMIAGPTGSGKTVLVRRLLENFESISVNMTPFRVLWAYGQMQELYTVPLNGVQVEYHEGLPTEEFLTQNRPTLLIIDDLMTELAGDKQTANLFTKGSHHLNISVIFIVQNVFHQGKEMRTISLNSHYMLLLKNPRDKAQVYALARQVYPTNMRFMLESYENATSRPFGYLLIDLKPDTPDELRLRTNIESSRPTIYVPKKL
jgi:hypothetical protein